MWPLLLLLLLGTNSGASKGAQQGGKPGGGGGVGGDGGQCSYITPTKMGFTIPMESEVADLTPNEYAAMVYVMKAMNARLLGMPFYTPWKVCSPQDVATIATVPLDDMGALAMMVYWQATKSKAARPWPTNDLEVLAKADVVNPFPPNNTLSAANYFEWRIKTYKLVLKQYLAANYS